MNTQEVTGLFALAGIPVLGLYEIANQYWPNVEHYAKIRADNPWWLVKTKQGLIRIGWRKRVIEIDWSDTKVEATVTKDAVTMSNTMVHAWSTEDALRYLKVLAVSLDSYVADPGWRHVELDPVPAALCSTLDTAVPLLLYCAPNQVIGRYNRQLNAFFVINENSAVNPSHWMPLPASPEQVTK